MIIPEWQLKHIKIVKNFLGIDDVPLNIKHVPSIVTPDGEEAWAMVDYDTDPITLYIDEALPETSDNGFDGHYVLTHEPIHVAHRHVEKFVDRLINSLPEESRAEIRKEWVEINEDFVHNLTNPLKDVISMFDTDVEVKDGITI